MILIADSGATKTDWWWGCNDNPECIIQTEGINPFHQGKEDVTHIITSQLLPQLPQPQACTHVFFYGAGCTPAKSEELKLILAPFFVNATIEVASDLLGAARSLCANSPGIACILGTGSNSCYYDGQKIIRNTPPLGYILGDEGSGAVLGKQFVADGLKGLLPADLFDSFLEEYGYTLGTLLEQIYRKPLANRFLAGLTPYIYKHRTHEAIHRLLIDSFTGFIKRNLHAYPAELPVSFTGSIAWYFRNEVTESLILCGLKPGRIIQKPLDGLVTFHLKQAK